MVDAVGAVDTFMGALLDGLIEADLIGADRRAALRDIPLALIDQIVRHSAHTAAVTVSRPGADPPTLSPNSPHPDPRVASLEAEKPVEAHC